MYRYGNSVPLQAEEAKRLFVSANRVKIFDITCHPAHAYMFGHADSNFDFSVTALGANHGPIYTFREIEEGTKRPTGEEYTSGGSMQVWP